MDKVRFALESDEDTDGEKEETEKDKDKERDKETPTAEKPEHEVDSVPPKNRKSATRRSRKSRHASSGGSSGDVFPSKSKLGSIKRRARRATESSKTSGDLSALDSSIKCSDKKSHIHDLSNWTDS